MRRLLFLAGCAVVLPGCGGGGGSSTTDTAGPSGAVIVTAGLDPPAGCYVTVFMVEEATKAQITQVRNTLLNARKAVTQISYVTKELALERFTRTNPALAKTLHRNPFSGRWEVVPRTQLAVFAIISDFATNGGPITNVRPSAGCRAGPA